MFLFRQLCFCLVSGHRKAVPDGEGVDRLINST